MEFSVQFLKLLGEIMKELKKLQSICKEVLKQFQCDFEKFKKKNQNEQNDF